MQFNVGDKVRFLNDVGEGKITAINASDIVVEDEFGFENTHHAKELVLASTKKAYVVDDQAIKEKEEHTPKSFYQKFNHVKKSKSTDFMEVDLHIENLIDSHKGMENYQIVEVQMANFRRSLNIAMNKRLKKIVFIHGVGSGILRAEIRQELSDMHPHFEYRDASYQEYGQGATEVLLTYK